MKLRPSRRTILLTSVAAIVSLLCGCGNSRVPAYPVRGKVMFMGKPAAGAIIIFHPVPEGPEPVLRPSGRTEADGTFTLTSYDPADGAPEGNYRVTIQWEEKLAPGYTPPKPRKRGDGEDDFFRGKYASMKSPLQATIAAQPNELAPFSLTK